MHKLNELFGDLGPHFERLNYYFGKMMTVRDFKAEQSYMNEKRWLLNRLGLGWGVLCGLKVIPCGGSRIAIMPGFAVDRWGHEIYLSEHLEVDLAKEKMDQEGESEVQSPPEPDCWYIYLKYIECPAEPAPVALEECGEVETACEYGRIREVFKVEVTREIPDIQRKFKSELKNLLHCEIDCVRFLEDYCPVIIEGCPTREKCLGVPLARVCHSGSDISEDDIDNCNYRQLAFSNKRLYELFACLREEVWKLRAAAFDRRQYVPILAQTIKGLSYHNGKILTQEEFGTYPTRLTSDGDFIWVTDREETKIRRINIAEEDYIGFSEIDIGFKSWGIAYDRRRMWVTCQNDDEGESGKVIGINVCNLSDRVEINGLKPKPREVVYDDRYLWVSHDVRESTEGSETHYLSKIDPWALTLIESYPLSIPYGEVDSEFKTMLFDGTSIWVAFDATNGRGLREIDISGDAPVIGEAVVCESDYPEDLAFDGQRLWLSGEEGLAEIDILIKKTVRRALKRRDQTAMAFDGRYIWTAEPKQGRVNRINPLIPEGDEGGQEIRATRETKRIYEASNMCFDGHYIWIAASEKIATSEKEDEDRRGIIHRLLA